MSLLARTLMVFVFIMIAAAVIGVFSIRSSDRSTSSAQELTENHQQDDELLNDAEGVRQSLPWCPEWIYNNPIRASDIPPVDLNGPRCKARRVLKHYSGPPGQPSLPGPPLNRSSSGSDEAEPNPPLGPDTQSFN